MSDYTPNNRILVEIIANRKWMAAMMDGMPMECLTDCAEEITSLRSWLKTRTDERDEARREVCRRQHKYVTFATANAEAESLGWDCFREDK